RPLSTRRRHRSRTRRTAGGKAGRGGVAVSLGRRDVLGPDVAVHRQFVLNLELGIWTLEFVITVRLKPDTTTGRTRSKFEFQKSKFLGKHLNAAVVQSLLLFREDPANQL